jgi:hypothetical protein
MLKERPKCRKEIESIIKAHPYIKIEDIATGWYDYTEKKGAIKFSDGQKKQAKKMLKDSNG